MNHLIPPYTVQRPNKPGPKPNRCMWCSQIQCTHCQCPGYDGCDHHHGKPCSRFPVGESSGFERRYKRRLVCNTCEKAKLREEKIKKARYSRSKGPFSRRIITNDDSAHLPERRHVKEVYTPSTRGLFSYPVYPYVVHYFVANTFCRSTLFALL